MRDVDKRPLPKVAFATLSQAMRSAVEAILREEKADAPASDRDRATPPSLQTTIYRIPVAPRGHALYLLEQEGELACAPNGANCNEAVLDETRAGIDAVTTGGVAEIRVVRRPHLQMPDIAAYEQEGHFAMDITVFRFDGKSWHAYRCKEISPIGADPDPAVIADRPCT